MSKTRQVPAGVFRAKCLALLDEVAATGQELVVTKRGRPVAKVVPAEDADPASLRGSVLWYGDIVSPIDADWDADKKC